MQCTCRRRRRRVLHQPTCFPPVLSSLCKPLSLSLLSFFVISLYLALSLSISPAEGGGRRETWGGGRGVRGTDWPSCWEVSDAGGREKCSGLQDKLSSCSQDKYCTVYSSWIRNMYCTVL
jgi:hypothetical protein